MAQCPSRDQRWRSPGEHTILGALISPVLFSLHTSCPSSLIKQERLAPSSQNPPETSSNPCLPLPGVQHYSSTPHAYPLCDACTPQHANVTNQGLQPSTITTGHGLSTPHSHDAQHPQSLVYFLSAFISLYYKATPSSHSTYRLPPTQATTTYWWVLSYFFSSSFF
jgi:hypothetical protein